MVETKPLLSFFLFLFLLPSSSVLSMSSFLLVLNHFIFPFFNSAKKQREKKNNLMSWRWWDSFTMSMLKIRFGTFQCFYLTFYSVASDLCTHCKESRNSALSERNKNKNHKYPQTWWCREAVWPPHTHSLPLPPAFGPAAFRCKRSRHMERRSLCCDPPKDSDCMTNHVQGCSASSILRPPPTSILHHLHLHRPRQQLH